mmetsp:Transcript_101430/g.254252  ORF Transcript_101430/g.254252 Transcript_101430/m.254252 type:complete len:85 (+) Transcript_101430:2-256(+)
MIERNAGAVCRSTPGIGVVAMAIQHASQDDQIWIARAVFQEPELPTCMACVPQGIGAVMRMLQVLIDCDHISPPCSLHKYIADL